MKTLLPSLAVSVLVLSMTSPAPAQVIDQAAAEARARVACGAGTLVSAQYIGGGLLRVTCSQQSSQSQNVPPDSVLAGTGLVSPLALGIVLSVGVIALISGSDGTPVSSTTSTSTPGGNAAER